MLGNLMSLTLVSRPVSWLNTAYPFAAAYLVGGGQINLFFWLGLVYFLIPYNLLMYGVNDVFDYESDMQNPRKGGLEGAKEQKSLHPTILAAAIALNVPFLLYLLSQGTLSANLVLAVVVFSVVAYSIKGLRFKEVPLLDSFTSSLHFVGPMVYALTLTGFSSAHLPFVVAFLLWGIASHAFGAVQDIIPDRKAGISSIATARGARRTIRLVIVLYVLTCMIVVAQGGLAIIVGLVGLIYALNVLPYLQINDASSAATNPAWRRFIWLNMIAGFVITMTLLAAHL